MDDPPHRIEYPEVEGPPPEEGAEPPGWNAHYLGEHMAESPSLDFDRLDDVLLTDPRIGLRGTEVYLARLFTEPAALDPLDAVTGAARTELEATDFDEQVLVAVATGLHSSSRQHRWKRVEARDGTLHLHGYTLRPHLERDDLDVVHSLVRVERPADCPAEHARGSFTTGSSTRVHFDSTEGVVVREE